MRVALAWAAPIATTTRVAVGDIGPDLRFGIELADGTLAGVGDYVVTRHNDRLLTTSDAHGFVKNGDTWTLQRRHRDGDLTLRRSDHTQIRLPHDYVAKHLELGYATTAARAQGCTVDTAHALIDRGYTRETLYVTLTRARISTTLFVTTGETVDLDAERPPSPATEATDVLASLIKQDAAQLAATHVARHSDLDSVQRRYTAPRRRSHPTTAQQRAAQMA